MTLMSTCCGFLTPKILYKPLPPPLKYPYPWKGYGFALGKGKGRCKNTWGLPVPITNDRVHTHASHLEHKHTHVYVHVSHIEHNPGCKGEQGGKEEDKVGSLRVASPSCKLLFPPRMRW